jgi:hypothetical protein
MKQIKFLINSKNLLTTYLLIPLTLMAFTIGCLKRNESDDVRYHRLAAQRNLDVQNEIENRKTGNVLPQQSSGSYERMIQYKQLVPKLLASGYLTNLSIALLPTDSLDYQSTRLIDEISSSFFNVLPNDYLTAAIDANYQSNTMFVKLICPTSDIPIIKEVVQKEVYKMNSKNRP